MDGFTADITIDINEATLANKLEAIVDEETMLSVHKLLAKMCDPYVPFQEGVLSQTLEITPDYVRYIQPYAHYMYMGLVYGPNIPLIENGVIVGWRSPPGKGSKHPTGKRIQYGTGVHSQASAEWDKAMMRDHGDEFTAQVKEILIRRAQQLYD